MIRSNDIKTGLHGVVGWRQNYDTADYTIANSLTDTSSGMYFQEVHPLLTLDNVKAVAPTFADITYDGWLVGTQYYRFDRVTIGGVNYRAKRDNLGADPASSPNDWEPFDAFSEWLEDKTKGSILKAVRSLWTQGGSEKTMKSVLEARRLLDNTSKIDNLITGTDSLVGFELVPIRSLGVTTKIQKIGLQFTDTDEITVYLLHSSQRAVYKQQTFQRTKDGGMEWFEPTDWVLPYAPADLDAGGSWYLAYDQTGLAGQAVNANQDFSKKPNGYSYSENADYISKYLEVHPFRTSDFTSGAVALWDVTKNQTVYTTNWGINLQFSVECDPTDLIIEQKGIFQDLIGLQVAIDLLGEMAYNPESKVSRKNETITKMDIMYALDGDSQSYKKSGLRYEFSKALTAVELDLAGMSRVCFKCKGSGIKRKTA